MCLMFHNLWSPVNAMAAGFLGPCALCDKHLTAIPLVKQATCVIPSVHPLIVKQSLSRIFIKLRHFRHLFYILMFLKLQPPTMHDCEILTSHGGDSHDNHDYPSAGLSRHGCYTLTASNSDALGPVKSCCRA